VPTKVFHFDSSPDPYVADAAVLCCFDERIRLVVNKFLRKIGVLRPDMIIVAGGAKTLASPSKDYDRDFVLEQMRLSIRLHQPPRVILMNHSDCGTYGGLAFFNNDPALEMTRQSEELARAARVVRAEFPTVVVETYFVTYEGVFAMDGGTPR
jgi:carbonic anhydrase